MENKVTTLHGFPERFRLAKITGVREARGIRFDDVAGLDSEPQQSGWGYGFSFSDPEAYVWGSQ